MKIVDKSTTSLLNVDCMEYMATQPDDSFDLAIVDPEYGINLGSMRLNNTIYKNKKWDLAPPESKYWKELFRLSVNQIIWGGNYFPLPPSPCFLVWDKKQPEGVTFAMAELAWTSFKSKIKVFREFPSHVVQGKRIHPAQKPVKLYQWLLTNYAKPGQRILDTHLGSGSSAIAAHYYGVDFVGCELDKDYFDAAEKRFKQETAQLSLLG